MVSALFMSIIGCKQEVQQATLEKKQYHYTGLTMGTTYNIKFSSKTDFPQKKIDSILLAFNDELSTYIDTSFITIMNNNGEKTSLYSKAQHKDFVKVFEKAKEIYELTDGAFDPTVKPLVDYWGFGNRKERVVYDKEEVDQIMKFVGYEKIDIHTIENQFYVEKLREETSLDFSAIAKGYGVDIIAEALEGKGIDDYMVEIGGETRTKGLNPKAKKWLLGVFRPVPGVKETELIAYIEPEDKAMASSGNYRNFYVEEGKIYSHTINPKTGESVPSDLLAVTVLAEDCITADAIATSCMVMGLDKAKQLVGKMDKVEACFFYQVQDSIQFSYSTRFKEYIKN